MNKLPASPILNPEEFLQGKAAIMPVLVELTPVKLSIMENCNGCVIQDAQGRIFIVSIGAVSRLGWDKLGLPESDAYEKHMEEWIKINGVQNV